MKKIIAFGAAALVLMLGSARADLLGGWDVTNTPGNQVSMSATYVASGVSSGFVIRGAGLTATSATNSFVSSAWANGGGATIANAISSNDYFSVSLTASSGYTLDITNVIFNLNRSGTGPTNFTLRSSADSYASDLATLTRTTTTAALWDSGALSTLTGLSTIEFRIYGYNAGASGGTARIAETGNAGLGVGDYVGGSIDFAINGSVVPEPGTVAFFGIGLGAISLYRRRKLS